MTQYLRQAVPNGLIEAARVDGATMIRTFWTVGVPAARPAAAMLFLFIFVGAWNNFFWPFIVLDRQNPTLPVALSLLQSNYFVDYSIRLAGVVLATVPLLLLFIFAGRQLVRRYHGWRSQGVGWAVTLHLREDSVGMSADAHRTFPPTFLFAAQPRPTRSRAHFL